MGTEPALLLEALDVRRNYGRHTAVSGLSMQLKRGDVCAFLGLNGAGKTTTLRMLCGCLSVDAGIIRVGGIDLQKNPQSARALLGFLPDVPPIYPELLVDEYLVYCARLRRVPRAQCPDRIEEVKALTGLADYGRRQLAQLSRGYLQRVGIAQAIVHRPSVLILDEPTAGLDPKQIQEMQQLICDYGRDAAVLLSSHLLSEVGTICNRVMILHRGKIDYHCDLDRSPAGLEALEQAFFEVTQGA